MRQSPFLLLFGVYMKKLLAILKSNRRFAVTALIFLSVGAVYFVFTEVTDIYIPCIFNRITGLVCPGCGISHFCTDIIKLDFYSAFRQNAAVAVLSVIWGIIGLTYLFFRPATLRKNGKVFNVFIWGSVIFLIVFGVIRNIPAFSYFLPLYMQ